MQQREEAGINQGMIRIAVGLEDLQADCERGFAATHEA